MNYQETIDFLFQMLPMYQRIGKSAYKKDLTNTIELLRVLNDPHKKFKSIHIAGTNGKGTSAHAIAAIMQLSKYKTGLYTSPHLRNFTERIKINGTEVDQNFIVKFIERMRPHIERIRPSFFEITVVMAFYYFAEQEVDIAVIETGLGGRLDSTNVIDPEVCLITNIGLDHTDLLGDTLEKIAYEKAGIIKKDVPVVLGKVQPEIFHVFQEKANNIGTRVVEPSNNTSIDQAWPYFKKANVLGVVATIAELRKKCWTISEEAEHNGFNQFEQITGFKGRFQLIQKEPDVIADVSHNKEGLKILFKQLELLHFNQLFLIFGTTLEKKLEPLFKLFPAKAKLYWTQSQVPRALPADKLAKAAEKSALPGLTFTDVNSAIEAALKAAHTNDLVLITGSTFVVAEINRL